MSNRLIFTILLIVLAGCGSQAAPIADSFYATNFDGAGQWTQTHTRQADISVEDGRLHIVLKQPDTLAWSVAGLELADFTLEVDAEQVEGPDDNGYGIVARRVDDENFYSFQVSGDGYFLIQKRAKGEWVNLSGDWQEAPAVHPGRDNNHLRVTCKGSALTFAVNGTQLAQVSDRDFKRGDIGVIAGALAEPGVHIAFDNVSVGRDE